MREIGGSRIGEQEGIRAGDVRADWLPRNQIRGRLDERRFARHAASGKKRKITVRRKLRLLDYQGNNADV